MDVQKDWDEVITKQDEKFWVLQKRPGESTIHGYLQAPNQKQKDEKFVIKNWKDKRLNVECTVTNTSTTFLAPQSTLSLSDTKPPQSLLSMDVSPSGELGVVSSTDGKLWIWDTQNAETKRVLAGHIGDVDVCRFFPSGLAVLSGGSDLRVKIWSVPDGQCPRTLTGHTRGITDVCMIDRGRNIVSTSNDGTARLWECGSGQCIAVIAELSTTINGCGLIIDSSLSSITQPTAEHEYGTEGKLLLTVSSDKYLRLYDIGNRSKVGEYYYRDSSLWRGVSVGNDRVVVGAEDGNLILLDLRNINLPLMEHSFSSSPITSLDSFQNKLIAGYKNGTCIIWNLGDPTFSYTRLTGPDIDPITSITTQSHMTYTSCRDGCVRGYHLSEL